MCVFVLFSGFLSERKIASTDPSRGETARTVRASNIRFVTFGFVDFLSKHLNVVRLTVNNLLGRACVCALYTISGRKVYAGRIA